MASSINSAVSKAFDITEILESIILQLPCKDVLLEQRISKAWQTTITGSPSLQKALFFVPSRPLGCDLGVSMGSDVATLATREMKQIRDLQKRTPPLKLCTAQDVYMQSVHCGGTFTNPLMRRLFKLWRNGDGVAYTVKPSSLAKTHEQSSWTKMYLTQPPFTRLWVRRIPRALRTVAEGFTREDLRDYDRGFLKSTEDNTIQNASGVTIKDLLDHLENKWVKSHDDVFYLGFIGFLPKEGEEKWTERIGSRCRIWRNIHGLMSKTLEPQSHVQIPWCVRGGNRRRG